MDTSRTEMLIGRQGAAQLAEAHVAIFGLGGVGSFAAEAMARAGVGELSLFDSDTVSPSNANRQLVALQSTTGLQKTAVMAGRIRDINPAAFVHTYDVFYLPENAAAYPLSGYTYIIDAVDTVAAKLELVCRAQAAGVPIVSCMGTGNKLLPERLRIADLYETSVCPLCRVMRRELRRRGVAQLDVLFSDEPPVPAAEAPSAPRRDVPGSISFVPPVAGMLLAGFAIRRMLGLPH